MNYEEIINSGMNKSIQDLEEEFDILWESIRQWFSRFLMDHEENNKLECSYPIFRNRDYFGLSENDMPYVDIMYTDNEGLSYIHIYGEDELEFHEISEYDIEDLFELMKQMEY